MAPKKMPRRVGIKKIPTYDTDPEQLFGLWKKAGRIPAQYKSWDDLKIDFMTKIQEGMTAPQAREAVGVTYKNIIGNPILNVEKNKDTGQIEFAEGGMRRAIREDFNIAEENQIRRTHGEAEVQRFRAELQNDWNNLSEGERVAIQKQYHKQFHRGHVKGAKTGGSIARVARTWAEKLSARRSTTLACSSYGATWCSPGLGQFLLRESFSIRRYACCTSYQR
jgi:hypothetical protein